MPYTSWSESVLKSSLLATLGRIHLCSGVYSRSLINKGSRSVLDTHMEMVEAARSVHSRQINDPSSGKHYSLAFLPATPSSLSWTLEGLFELTRRPSPALDSPRALLPELQRYKDTVRCAALGAEVPAHLQNS